jgi:integrase
VVRSGQKYLYTRHKSVTIGGVKIRSRTVKGHVYWQVDLGMLNGKRTRRNFKTENEAKTFFAAKKRERAMYGRSALALDEKTRRAFLHHGDRLAAVGATLDDAVTHFLASRPAQRATLRNALDDALLDKERAGRRKEYLDRLRSVWTGFAHDRQNKHLDEITAPEIGQWLGAYGWTPVTRAGNLEALTVLFSWGIKRGYLTANPCSKVERIAVDWKAPAIFTPDECARLMRSAEDHDAGMLAFLALGLFAGIRPFEIQRLAWRNVDIDGGHVIIDATVAKTRQRRLVPLNDTAKAWLRLGGDLPVKNLGPRRTRIAEAAGLEWSHDVLRHSAASYMLAHHQDAGKVALWLGNSPSILFRHYRELVTPAQAAQWLAILPA